jgi:hypothetical protein
MGKQTAQPQGLLDEDDGVEEVQLQINEDFAKRFEVGVVCSVMQCACSLLFLGGLGMHSTLSTQEVVSLSHPCSRPLSNPGQNVQEYSYAQP